MKVIYLHRDNWRVPALKKAYDEDAGFDLHAGVSMYIQPGRWALVPTGLAMVVPVGYEVQIRPRSGLAARNGVTVLNAPGTVDAGYRGEVQVVLVNHGPRVFPVALGDRIAQAVVCRLPAVEVEEVDGDLFEALQSARGARGFGSSG